MLKTGFGIDILIQICYILLGFIGALLGVISGLTGYIVKAMATGNRKEHEVFIKKFKNHDNEIKENSNEIKENSEEIQYIKGTLQK